MTASSAAWRNFPRCMIAVMLLVFAVNVRFIVLAATTFPGAATADDFDTSNRYNAILDQAARERALGWTVRAGTLGPRPTLDLVRADDTPLAHATVTGRAERPLGPMPPTELSFHETAPGHYAAVDALTLRGQWDLTLLVTLGGRHIHATRRVIVR